MDQKTIHTGGMITGAIVMGCGVLVSPVGIGLTLSYPHELWWLGVVLCVSCSLMIYGGVQTIRKNKKSDKQARQEVQRIKEEVAQSTLSPQPTNAEKLSNSSDYREVLAHWIFTETEWKKFLKQERARRKSSTRYEAVAIIVLGTILLMMTRNASFFMALIMSALIAVIISVLRNFLTMQSYGDVRASNEVTITDQSIMINGKLNPYRSENFWLDKIQIMEGNPTVLEFTYAWTARKGKTFDELRVPIPNGKREKAQSLMKKILSLSL